MANKFDKSIDKLGKKKIEAASSDKNTGIKAATGKLQGRLAHKDHQNKTAVNLLARMGLEKAA
ncbi:MAG: hypothetical protein FWF34_01295 [Alphaproteobacteria bacterium]|nr:hypothetical protein [Alphaproteobacteria bacterium]MCL2889877.1 hypothetical protein [Alphaproteobacteria bacterium]